MAINVEHIIVNSSNASFLNLGLALEKNFIKGSLFSPRIFIFLSLFLIFLFLGDLLIKKYLNWRELRIKPGTNIFMGTLLFLIILIIPENAFVKGWTGRNPIEDNLISLKDQFLFSYFSENKISLLRRRKSLSLDQDYGKILPRDLLGKKSFRQGKGQKCFTNCT